MDNQPGGGPSGGPPSQTPPCRLQVVDIRMKAAHAAFVAFAEEQRLELVRFVMRCGASLAEAESAAREAFAEGWRLISRDLREWRKVGDERLWIRKVALGVWTGTGGMRPLLPEVATVGVELADLAGQALDTTIVLAALPPGQRLAMALHRDGFGPAEVAAFMEVPEPEAARLLGDARATLRVSLAAYRTTQGEP
ncbi:hypothetical protein ACIBEJ_12440 [Nonomuraea sp. NPDC050790]|uniref:hypothetical protein n=1 Tax=Nonomuraea sp. NPDC050790 TaxID=3364371 RepID=UPI00379BBFAF